MAGAARTENDGFVVLWVYRQNALPYNPVIASGRGAKRLRTLRQGTEIAKVLAVEVVQDPDWFGATRLV